MVEPSDLRNWCLAVSLELLAGVCAFPMLNLPRKPRSIALAGMAAAISLMPLLIRQPMTELRFVTTLVSIMLIVKLYDLHFAMMTGPRPAWGDFLTYLPNGCRLVLRRDLPKTAPSRREDAIRLLWLLPATISCLFALSSVWQYDWQFANWFLEHCVKVVIVCLGIQFGANVITTGWRLSGVAALDFSGWFVLSATPAEFWRRWNQPAGQFLSTYVFRPLGGTRRLFWPIMATFALNGVVHEYVFGMATGNVQGWALPFFLVQGLTTAATVRIRPKGWTRPVGLLLTLAFNLSSAILLFDCVNNIVPFYAAR